MDAELAALEARLSTRDILLDEALGNWNLRRNASKEEGTVRFLGAGAKRKTASAAAPDVLSPGSKRVCLKHLGGMLHCDHSLGDERRARRAAGWKAWMSLEKVLKPGRIACEFSVRLACFKGTFDASSQVWKLDLLHRQLRRSYTYFV